MRAGLVVLALLCGCGASVPRTPAPVELQGLPQVTVTLGPQIVAERAQAFQEQDGATRLRDAVLDEMIAHRQRWPADDVSVLVTGFRLRSTSAGFWLGAMAGVDVLDVAVTVAHDGATVRTFTTGAGGFAAGIIKPSASGRFNGLVKEVAERIVKEL